ncbi:MAG: histidine--tRNA ligase [Planctomycetota bacterium]|jgi:histidyl-tRNA synthetase
MTEQRVEARIFKGLRDALPEKGRIRRIVIDRLRSVFESFGFEPLETPAIEFYDILTGKSGEEADRLIFPLAYGDGRTLALRYDLTVPLSRVVAMYGGSLALPFKRYQIQPVWRAEKPQRGRYREFLQCDVDTVGTARMEADAEIILLTCDAMERLGFSEFRMELNNRKVINGLYEALSIPEGNGDFVSRTVDKLAKIGRDEVRRILAEGEGGEPVEAKAADGLLDLLEGADLAGMEKALAGSETGREGVGEVREILELLADVPVAAKAVRFTPAMVRGLDYYTGPIFEMMVDEPRIGSLGGGGRYDGLVGLYTGENRPAVGFSFGLERLVDALEDRAEELAGPGANRASDALVTVFSPELRKASMALAATLRAAGVRTEVFLGKTKKFGKQFDYANRRNIPVVLTLGPDEVAKGTVAIKWMDEGKQETVARGDVSAKVAAKLAGTSGKSQPPNPKSQ